MKLYEVNATINGIIEQMVDPETGEILEVSEGMIEALESLQMERRQILEYVAKLALNERAEAAALKEEEKRLAARRKKAEAKEARLIEILDRECAGKKTDLGVAPLNYRMSSSLEVKDAQKAIDWLYANGYTECIRVKDPEIAKDEVKKLMKAGMEVPGGCQIVENVSRTLK